MQKVGDERRRVQRICAALQKSLDMDYWDIHHHFADHLEGAESDEPSRICCVTQADWQYRQAHLYWYLPVTITLSDETIEYVAIHEYVHILLNPLDSNLRGNTEILAKLNEFTTECICRVIMAAAGKKRPPLHDVPDVPRR